MNVDVFLEPIQIQVALTCGEEQGGCVQRRRQCPSEVPAQVDDDATQEMSRPRGLVMVIIVIVLGMQLPLRHSGRGGHSSLSDSGFHVMNSCCKTIKES